MFDHLIHIHQQFNQRETGIELQRFRSITTQNPQKGYELDAYNEYLILTNAHALPIGTRIISDTNSLEIVQDHSSLEGIEEFSGLVRIELPQETQQYPVIEFIQIVKE
jgi:hypothetical protein